MSQTRQILPHSRGHSVLRQCRTVSSVSRHTINSSSRATSMRFPAQTAQALNTEQVVGSFGCGVPNANSVRLLTVCTLILSIIVSWFQLPGIRRWIWMSNDGCNGKELDHFLTRRHPYFRSYRVLRGAECPANTDHRLVALLAIDLCSVSKRLDVKPRINNELLVNDQGLRDTSAPARHNRFASLADPANRDQSIQKSSKHRSPTCCHSARH